jgi:hypothetical protein
VAGQQAVDEPVEKAAVEESVDLAMLIVAESSQDETPRPSPESDDARARRAFGRWARSRQ